MSISQVAFPQRGAATKSPPLASDDTNCRLDTQGKIAMKMLGRIRSTSEDGKVGWALLWLLGVPIPILLIFFLLRGCT